MSECNYCRLKRLRSEAARDGNKVVLRKGEHMDGLIGVGVDVYVMPVNETLIKECYWRAWYMALGRSCEC